MRLLFVNHVAPQSGLVGGLRLSRFAQELAGRGHRVLLLHASADRLADTPNTLERRASVHDWSQPLCLAVPDATPTRRRIALGHARRYVQRACTALDLTIHGGPFWHWRRKALGFQEAIHRILAPELAYATFGNLDALGIARDYAEAYAIPWVMDIKDAPAYFVPRVLAPRLMHPFRDAAAVTLNAEFQRTRSGPWCDRGATLLYSGVEPPIQGDVGFDPSRIAWVGSLYDDVAAMLLLRGFAAWREQVAPRAALHYFGIDRIRLQGLARKLGGVIGLEIVGQVPRQELLARCRQSAALLYIASPERTFHHKLLELAVLGRPLLVAPAESGEARSLCGRYSIALYETSTVIEVRDALVAASQTASRESRRLVAELAWCSAAERLENVFESVVVGAAPTAKDKL